MKYIKTYESYIQPGNKEVNYKIGDIVVCSTKKKLMNPNDPGKVPIYGRKYKILDMFQNQYLTIQDIVDTSFIQIGWDKRNFTSEIKWDLNNYNL